MEYLINNQARERHLGQESGGPKERRIPPQKTSSFREKRRPQGWLQQKFSDESTDGYDTNGVDQAVAVAAAAQAIASLENKPDIPVHRKIREVPPEPTTSQISSKKVGKKTVSILEPGENSFRRTTSSIPTATSVPEIVSVDEDDDAASIKPVWPTPSMKRASSSASLDDQIANGPGVATPDINIEARGSWGYVPSTKRAPSFPEKPALPMQRIPSFAERQLTTMEETVPKTKRKALLEAETLTPKTEMEGSRLVPPTTRKLAMEIDFPKLDLPRPPTMKRQGSTMTAGREGSNADTWEITKLAKIKKKYDELNNKINSWENKKKAKARRRLDKTESELARTRLKATNKFQTETIDINNMAAAARAHAAERQRNEELKLKAKTNRIRPAGKVRSRTCFCF